MALYSDPEGCHPYKAAGRLILSHYCLLISQFITIVKHHIFYFGFLKAVKFEWYLCFTSVFKHTLILVSLCILKNSV